MMRNSDDGSCYYMRGMLGFLILYLLSKKSMHGHEIANEMSQRKGESPVLELYIQH
jgi:PadR family transcriptional regulator, regulatory protein PadR